MCLIELHVQHIALNTFRGYHYLYPKQNHNYKAALVSETSCAKQVVDICRAW